jgi:putative metalloprotease
MYLMLGAAMACLAGNALAIDWGSAINAGKTAVQGVTLSDADIQKTADEGCAWMDENNPVAPASDKYAARLKKLTAGLENEDGMKLTFKAYKVKDVNAFAMANGCVRVFAGLMDIATDDEIRGVIGHEIGHAKLGHSKAKLRTAMLARSAREGAAAAGGTVGELAKSELGGLTEEVINAQFSQQEESEADVYGYHFMVRHKYDPNGLVSLFKKLGSGGGGLTSSHPASPDRAAKIEAMIKEGK